MVYTKIRLIAIAKAHHCPYMNINEINLLISTHTFSPGIYGEFRFNPKQMAKVF